MTTEWSPEALLDVTRLYDFLAAVAEPAAHRLLQALASAPRRLERYPRLGERVSTFKKREVRRLIINGYEMRYEFDGQVLRILNIWNAREDR